MLAAAAILLPLIAGAARAQDAGPARSERWRPLSATATNLTGTVRFTPGRIEFGNGAALPLTDPHPLQDFTAAGSTVDATLYRVAAPANPSLLRRSMLCGLRQKARYVVIWTPAPSPGAADRGLAVFASRTEPKAEDSPGLCGIFSYVVARVPQGT